jgi:hypothetical protein
MRQPVGAEVICAWCLRHIPKYSKIFEAGKRFRWGNVKKCFFVQEGLPKPAEFAIFGTMAPVATLSRPKSRLRRYAPILARPIEGLDLLASIQKQAKRGGLDSMPLTQINSEIAAYRQAQCA